MIPPMMFQPVHKHTSILSYASLILAVLALFSYAVAFIQLVQIQGLFSSVFTLATTLGLAFRDLVIFTVSLFTGGTLTALALTALFVSLHKYL